MKQKQPATESLQRWLIFLSTLLLAVLGYQSQQLTYQNRQITAVLSTVATLTERVANNQDHIESIIRDIDRLENWRNSIPFRKPDKTAFVPRWFLLPDRRIVHMPVRPPLKPTERF